MAATRTSPPVCHSWEFRTVHPPPAHAETVNPLARKCFSLARGRRTPRTRGERGTLRSYGCGMTVATRPAWPRAIGFWWLVLTALAVGAFAPLQYLGASLETLAANDLPLAGNYMDRPAWTQAFFYAHIVGGGLALLLSPIQLSARVRARVPRLHRMTGRVVLGSIAVGGVAGLVLAPHNVAGLDGTIGFGALAVLWLTFATLGFLAIRRGAVTIHRRWMLRTFALTYAAVTLRLWLAVLTPVTGEFVSAYQFVPFLAWVPNLVLAEVLIRRWTSSDQQSDRTDRRREEATTQA
jgi:hypothetical protein